jgi:hypothetical protein
VIGTVAINLKTGVQPAEKRHMCNLS